MLDAGLARWCVGLAGIALSCQRAPTDARANEREHARHEQELASERDAERGERAALLAARDPGPTGSATVPSEPVGGRWVSCYANYRPTSMPERDLARLVAMCGPENGMVPVGPIVTGDAGDAVENQRLEAERGDCFRIFAVADAFVTDLGVEIVNPRGNAITWDRNGDRWPILNPEGPFCVFDAGTYTIRVRANQGRGRYALQVWRLP
jgi:hypothetical protein